MLHNHGHNIQHILSHQDSFDMVSTPPGSPGPPLMIFSESENEPEHDLTLTRAIDTPDHQVPCVTPLDQEPFHTPHTAERKSKTNGVVPMAPELEDEYDDNMLSLEKALEPLIPVLDEEDNLSSLSNSPDLLITRTHQHSSDSAQHSTHQEFNTPNTDPPAELGHQDSRPLLPTLPTPMKPSRSRPDLVKLSSDEAHKDNVDAVTPPDSPGTSEDPAPTTQQAPVQIPPPTKTTVRDNKPSTNVVEKASEVPTTNNRDNPSEMTTNISGKAASSTTTSSDEEDINQLTPLILPKVPSSSDEEDNNQPTPLILPKVPTSSDEEDINQVTPLIQSKVPSSSDEGDINQLTPLIQPKVPDTFPAPSANSSSTARPSVVVTDQESGESEEIVESPTDDVTGYGADKQESGALDSSDGGVRSDSPKRNDFTRQMSSDSDKIVENDELINAPSTGSR